MTRLRVLVRPRLWHGRSTPSSLCGELRHRQVGGAVQLSGAAGFLAFRRLTKR